MVALVLRRRPADAFSGLFWLSAVCTALMPTSIGAQDLAAFFARQPGVSQRWRDHLIASPFGTIHAATFSFTRPIGTAMPEPIGAQPVNFDPRAFDGKARPGDELPMARPVQEIEYPTVNRRLKGDRMPLRQTAPGPGEPESLPSLQPVNAPLSPPASPPPVTFKRPKSAEQLDPTRSDARTDLLAPPPSELQIEEIAGTVQANAVDERDDTRNANAGDDSAVADTAPGIPTASESNSPEPSSVSLSFLNEDEAERDAQVYFGVAALGSRDGLQQWGPGAAPVPVFPAVDPEIKLSALEQSVDTGPGGETVAGKGNASGFVSPAARLGLSGKPRAKAEKCIADAVYFEARGEPLRGQMAVAQVVMNRVFSGRYPNNVCGVVYQNANRRLACQFTFACEGKDLSRIDEPDMWEQAKRIAKDVLDGKFWLGQVGHATHYHAYWVRPNWVNEMAKLYKLGVHTFYRPRAWGDGSDAPIWGPVKQPEAATNPPEANARPSKRTREARL
ncbi:MAG: cell wall hydrolase [Xanthobacteraceae bacterium]